MTPLYISVDVPGRWFARGEDGRVWRRDPDRRTWVRDHENRFRQERRTALPRGVAGL